MIMNRESSRAASAVQWPMALSMKLRAEGSTKSECKLVKVSEVEGSKRKFVFYIVYYC